MPPVLDVIECIADAQTRERIRDVLQSHFRANLYPITSPEEIRVDLFATSPDLLLVDETFITRVDNQRNSDWNTLKEKAQDMSVIGIGVDHDRWEIDPEMYGYVEPGFSANRIIQVFEKAALARGYMVSQGKVGSRLVQRQVSVTLKFEDGSTIQGYTTGLNINGCGVRLGEELGHLSADESCRVLFRETDLSGRGPVEGTILEVAPNWVNNEGMYLRIKFDDPGFVHDPEVRELLESMIENQDDRSVRKRGREHRRTNGRNPYQRES